MNGISPSKLRGSVTTGAIAGSPRCVNPVGVRRKFTTLVLYAADPLAKGWTGPYTACMVKINLYKYPLPVHGAKQSSRRLQYDNAGDGNAVGRTLHTTCTPPPVAGSTILQQSRLLHSPSPFISGMCSDANACTHAAGAISNHVKGDIKIMGNLVMENNEADVSFRTPNIQY